MSVKKSNKGLIIGMVVIVLLLFVAMVVLVQKATNKSETEKKYSEYVTFESIAEYEPTTEVTSEAVTVETAVSTVQEETTRSMLDYLQEIESKKAEGLYTQPEVETYDYSLPYELFPYHITLGLYKDDVVLDFFSSDKYFQYKEDMGELGIYALESLYNICTMYDYSQDDLEEVTPTVFTDDASVTFNYNTPDGLLILVVDQINAQAYFMVGSEVNGE